MQLNYENELLSTNFAGHTETHSEAGQNQYSLKRKEKKNCSLSLMRKETMVNKNHAVTQVICTNPLAVKTPELIQAIMRENSIKGQN